MSNAESKARLRTNFFQYIIGLSLFIGLCALAGYTSFSALGFAAFILYFIIGIYLTKVCLPRLIHLHPMYNTIENEFSMKIRFILLWPLTYLVLFTKLGFLKAMR